MTRRSILTPLAILATMAATPLAAQAPNTNDLAGTALRGGNVVGGGGARLLGGGDDMVIIYSRGGAGGGGEFAQAGRLARFGSPHGDGLQVEYLAPLGAGTGREAWLLGGGDNAEVVYATPTRR